jgi:hypothetical protein
MNKHLQAALKSTQSMIDKMDKMTADAVRRENWKLAAEREAYTDGMRQIQVVFELAIIRMEHENETN